MTPFPYNEIVLEHFRNPRNVGKMENPDGKATEGSPACGDMVAVYLKVNEETKVIEDIKFESYGCASNIATGSIITELAKGKTLEEAKKITWKEASEALGGSGAQGALPVLAVEGLRSAVRLRRAPRFGTSACPPLERCVSGSSIVKNPPVGSMGAHRPGEAAPAGGRGSEGGDRPSREPSVRGGGEGGHQGQDRTPVGC